MDLKKCIEELSGRSNKVKVRCLIVFTKDLKKGKKGKKVEEIKGDKIFFVEFKNGEWCYEPKKLEDVLLKESKFSYIR